MLGERGRSARNKTWCTLSVNDVAQSFVNDVAQSFGNFDAAHMGVTSATL